jgi:hypothetical protein
MRAFLKLSGLVFILLGLFSCDDTTTIERLKSCEARGQGLCEARCEGFKSSLSSCVTSRQECQTDPFICGFCKEVGAGLEYCNYYPVGTKIEL